MADERVQRRLAAILAADVVGYSRLMGEDEAGTVSRLKSVHAELIDPKVAEYGGRIVKTTGDGVLIEFPSAVDAVQHAVDVQNELVRRNADLPDIQRLEIRIGINIGDVIVDGDDIFGDGVNVAARLEGSAEPGGISISGMVHESVRNRVDVTFVDLGEQSFKNIANPVRVYRIAVSPSGSAIESAVSDAVFRRPAVAVLPFDNLSDDPEQAYFADGLTEDIITALSLWRSFPVIARNSTFGYKGTSPDVREVGVALGARYIVEGSVRKAGNRVRVTAQLINAETGHHIWAERYDRDLDHVFELQDEIAREIASIMEPAIERSEHQRIAMKPPSDLAAWEYCVRGFAHIHEITREANEKAREMFRRAIELDPQYARAHTGLASCYGLDLRFFGASDRDERVRLMLDSARRAVALDETDAEARIALVRANLNAGRLDAGIAEARKAVQLNPHNAVANQTLGAALSTTSARYEEGIPWLERALQLNPSDPLLQVFTIHLAFAHLGAGRYDMAVRYAHDAVLRQPDFPDGAIALAATLGYLGRAEDARAAIEGHQKSVPGYIEQHAVYAAELKDCLLEGLRRAGLVG